MNSAILVAFLACLVGQVFSVGDLVHREACTKDAVVNPSLIDKAYNGEISDARELKCYFKCYYENSGFMDSKGEIQADKMKTNVPKGTDKTVAAKAIDLCKDMKGKDACETAYLTQKCLLNNNVKY